MSDMKELLMTIIAVVSLASVGYCQDQPLQVTVKANKGIYEVGEPINLELSIRNIGNKAVRIYSPDYWGTSEIVVTNSQGVLLKPRGAKVERTAFDVFMIIPPNESRTQIYSNLEWFHCGGAWQFSDDAQLPVGRYNISVTITNPPVDKCNSNKVFEKTDLSGTLTSNPIVLEVVGRKLSKEAIIKIAKNIPYDLNGIESIYDEDNKLWNTEWNRRRNYFGNLPQIYPPLTGKDYQAVYFRPPETRGLRAAGVWVFIDKDSGKIIAQQGEAN